MGFLSKILHALSENLSDTSERRMDNGYGMNSMNDPNQFNKDVDTIRNLKICGMDNNTIAGFTGMNPVDVEFKSGFTGLN